LSELSAENKNLFREQVKDHINKLGDLMKHASGDSLDGEVLLRACFAGRLLEGSTAMLGMEEWSQVLSQLRSLLEIINDGGGCWDENQSQVVCEVLEMEERVSGFLEDREIESIYSPEMFEGLNNEIKYLLSEYGEAKTGPSMDEGFSDSASVYIEEISCEEEPEEKFDAVERLISLFEELRGDFEFCLANREGWKEKIENMGRACGESEFYMKLVRDLINRVSEDGVTFNSRIPVEVVVQGIRNVILLYGGLKDWDVRFSPTFEDFSLDLKLASDLVRIVENCLFDISTLTEMSGEEDLNLELDIHSVGSYLEVVIRDNFQGYMNDPEVDYDDIVSYYKGLLVIRNILKDRGGLLWVEPEKGGGGRFKFTFPKLFGRTDMHVFSISGKEICVPSRMVAQVCEFDQDRVALEKDRYYLETADGKIPVFSMKELAGEDLDAEYEYGNMVVIGAAEERVAVFCEGEGYKVETIEDQLVGESWASISECSLQLGERSCPMLDVPALLEMANHLRGMNLSYAASGAVPAEEV